jgi:hypothetical protein
MQAGLEGRRTTQLWKHTNIGTRTLGTDSSFEGIPGLFSDSPTSFEWNVSCAVDTRRAQKTETAMPSHGKWSVLASEGTQEL